MPKPTFAGRSALYKVYLITDLDQVDDEIERNPTLEFVRQFFPILNGLLFDSPENVAG